ncbi:homoserine kinase [mine drainage metagenome]|uniref:Homoserine kinase n=1 Tax=mine drainage metagenome TaxID=410659 RepID=A0A1J5T297_9ZZZZ
MAVYTEVSDEELEAFVAQYDIGAVEGCKGIAEGVENSNFLLQTERGSYILTLYEKRVNPDDLPFFIGLMEHLARQGLACPTPLPGRDGRTLRELCGRPAAIISFLQGLWPRKIQAAHCAPLGRAMAEMHVAGQSYPGRRANSLGLAGWRPLFELERHRADQVKPGLEAMLAAELETLEAQWPRDLPSGIIHADLFPDNVFFKGAAVSGLIDFYFACTDFLAYDIAICLNAWCFEPDGAFNATKARALLTGYQQVRPLSAAEFAALPILCRGAAMRFLLTRLYDWVNTPAGAFVKRKDPLEYERKLRFHAQVTGPGAYGLDPVAS